VNIKVPFASRFGHSTGMKGMLSRLGLSLDGHHHCGLDDARNIAKIVIEFLKFGTHLDVTGNYESECLVQKLNETASTEPPHTMSHASASAQPPRRRWGKASCPNGAASSGQDGYNAECPPMIPAAQCQEENVKEAAHLTSFPKAVSKKKAHAPVRIDEPWLSWIVSGIKTHEGRLCRGTWAKLAPGHQLVAFSDRYERVELVVRDVLHFNDFDAAFVSLGKHLVPEGAETPAQALQLYRQWNSAEAVQKCGGIVAVEVEVGEVHLR